MVLSLAPGPGVQAAMNQLVNLLLTFVSNIFYAEGSFVAYFDQGIWDVGPDNERKANKMQFWGHFDKKLGLLFGLNCVHRNAS